MGGRSIVKRSVFTKNFRRIMPTDNEQGSSFRVIDKRRFSESGDERQEEVMTSSSATISEPRPEPVTTPPRSEREPKKAAAESVSQLDFSSLVMSLATQALVMMGEIPGHGGGQGERNLDGAQQTIDIIALLREKTKGNLTPDEDRLLEEVLAQLRLSFVSSIGR